MDINLDPEAFSDEYEERQAILRQLASERQAQEQAAIALITLLLEVGIARLNAEMAERGENVLGADYREWNEMVDASTPREEHEDEIDLFDFVRQHDESMDGDHESALASAGFGTDEDYGGYTHDWEDGG